MKDILILMDHQPYLTFFIALTLCVTLVLLIRGWPPPGVIEGDEEENENEEEEVRR